MENLTKNRQENLNRLSKVRKQVSDALQSGLLTDADIINIVGKDANYGIRNISAHQNLKGMMLKNIFNCPFLLCDQEYLSAQIKELLPHLLKARYNTEKDTLNCYLEQCFIDESEYKQELEDLEFYFYKSSNDGINIIETGHVANQENVLVKK